MLPPTPECSTEDGWNADHEELGQSPGKRNRRYENAEDQGQKPAVGWGRRGGPAGRWSCWLGNLRCDSGVRGAGGRRWGGDLIGPDGGDSDHSDYVPGAHLSQGLNEFHHQLTCGRCLTAAPGASRAGEIDRPPYSFVKS